MTIPSAHVGVRLRLVGGADPAAACGTLFTECYDTDSTNGVVHIRGWSTGTAPAARNAWLLAGSCAPDAYFATADCSAGIQAEVDLGATHPLTGAGVTADVWASVDGGGHYPLTPGGTSGLVTWTVDRRPADRGQRAAHRRAELDLGADRRARGTARPARTRRTTRARTKGRSAPSSVRSSPAGAPARSAASRCSRAASPRPGATPSRRGRRTRSASASRSPAASRCSRSRPTRSSSSASRAARTSRSTATPRSRTSGTRSSRAAGRRTRSTRPSPAPRTTSSGSLPEPWECVKTQTGGAVGQVEHGMKDRILGGANSCTAPINWPNYSSGDPRIVPLIITPFGTLQRLGQRHRPGDRLRRLLRRRLERRPLPGRARRAEGLHRRPLHQVRRAEPERAPARTFATPT